MRGRRAHHPLNRSCTWLTKTALLVTSHLLYVQVFADFRSKCLCCIDRLFLPCRTRRQLRSAVYRVVGVLLTPTGVPSVYWSPTAAASAVTGSRDVRSPQCLWQHDARSSNHCTYVSATPGLMTGPAGSLQRPASSLRKKRGAGTVFFNQLSHWSTLLTLDTSQIQNPFPFLQSHESVWCGLLPLSNSLWQQYNKSGIF